MATIRVAAAVVVGRREVAAAAAAVVVAVAVVEVVAGEAVATTASGTGQARVRCHAMAAARRKWCSSPVPMQPADGYRLAHHGASGGYSTHWV